MVDPSATSIKIRHAVAIKAKQIKVKQSNNKQTKKQTQEQKHKQQQKQAQSKANERNGKERT